MKKPSCLQPLAPVQGTGLIIAYCHDMPGVVTPGYAIGNLITADLYYSAGDLYQFQNRWSSPTLTKWLSWETTTLSVGYELFGLN